MSDIRIKGAEILESDDDGDGYALEAELSRPIERRERKGIVHADALHKLFVLFASEYEDEDGNVTLEIRLEDLEDEAEGDDNDGAGIPLGTMPDAPIIEVDAQPFDPNEKPEE